MKDTLLMGVGAAIVAITLGVVTSFAQTTSGTLNGLNNSNASGTYEFERVSDTQTRVTINLQGLPGNTTHAGHFHQGNSCNDIGPVTLPLNSIRADASGQGSMTQVVNSSLANIQNGNYLISYHQTDDSNSQSIACAAIAAASSSTPVPNPTTYTVPNTGYGGLAR